MNDTDPQRPKRFLVVHDEWSLSKRATLLAYAIAAAAVVLVVWWIVR